MPDRKAASDVPQAAEEQAAHCRAASHKQVVRRTVVHRVVDHMEVVRRAAVHMEVVRKAADRKRADHRAAEDSSADFADNGRDHNRMQAWADRRNPSEYHRAVPLRNPWAA